MVVAIRPPAGVERGEGVTIRDGVIGIVVGWPSDGVALALVEALCVDGVGVAGFAEVQPATITRTLTRTSTTLIIATFFTMRLTSYLVWALNKQRQRHKKLFLPLKHFLSISDFARRLEKKTGALTDFFHIEQGYQIRPNLL